MLTSLFPAIMTVPSQSTRAVAVVLMQAGAITVNGISTGWMATVFVMHMLIINCFSVHSESFRQTETVDQVEHAVELADKITNTHLIFLLSRFREKKFKRFNKKASLLVIEWLYNTVDPVHVSRIWKHQVIFPKNP